MYRPSALTLAHVLMDLPLIAFQHVLFILPFYLLSGLQINAGKFFFFYLNIYISTLGFSNLLRMFAYYVPSLDDCRNSDLERSFPLLMVQSRLPLRWDRVHNINSFCWFSSTCTGNAALFRLDTLDRSNVLYLRECKPTPEWSRGCVMY